MLATVVGIAASLGYFIQVYKIFKHKSSQDLSLTTFCLLAAAGSAWLAYGISIKNHPIIIANTVALAGVASVIIFYFIYRKEMPQIKP